MLDFAALASYLLVMSITPGPNNILVTASGARFGYRATIPHLLGIAIGAAAQIASSCLGLGTLFERLPALHSVLAWAGALYLCFLAWQLARAGAASESTISRPMSLVGAAAFQLINPKAWIMAITAASLFFPKNTLVATATLQIAALFVAINFPCTSIWAVFGSALRRVLAEPRYLRVFNVSMAMLLVMTAVLAVRG